MKESRPNFEVNEEVLLTASDAAAVDSQQQFEYAETGLFLRVSDHEANNEFGFYLRLGWSVSHWIHKS